MRLIELRIEPIRIVYEGLDMRVVAGRCHSIFAGKINASIAIPTIAIQISL
jgi:hypothetical protein